MAVAMSMGTTAITPAVQAQTRRCARLAALSASRNG